jgi:hypothetical protein
MNSYSRAQKQRDFPTFPQLLLLDKSLSKPKNQNRTFHLLQKPDILICYQHGKRAEKGLAWRQPHLKNQCVVQG